MAIVIQDVIDQALSGELRNLSKVAQTTDAIIKYTNLGMIELYKRFPLSTKEVVITLNANQTIYTLDSANVGTYLDAYSDDCMYIIDAYDESGSRININEETDPYSIMVPSPTQIQVPSPADDTYISIIFIAEPPRFSIAGLTEEQITTYLDETKVPIPATLLEALLHYIGYRAHGSVSGEIKLENNTHYMRFEASCKRAAELGVVTQDSMLGASVSMKGFV